jgi:hypothetical protein
MHLEEGGTFMRSKWISIGIFPLLFCLFLSGACSKHHTGNKVSAEEAFSARIILPADSMNITEGQSVNFEGTAVNGTVPYTYQWTFGGGASDSKEQNPGLVTFNTRGTYTVTLVVKDSKNAAASETRVISVRSPGAKERLIVSTSANHSLAIKPDGTLCHGDIILMANSVMEPGRIEIHQSK